MANEEILSVVMSVYNEQIEELKQAVDSILNQTFKKFEFLIVLDNPENYDLKRLLEEYEQKDMRIKVLYNNVNMGLAMSLNKAICQSKGYYIARMDADDISDKSRFEKQLLYFESHTECDVLGTNYVKIDENGNEINTDSQFFFENNEIVNALKYGNVLVHPSIMFRKNIFEKVGGYRNFKNSQDYDLWLRIMKSNGRFHVLSDVLIKYRVRVNSISSKNPARQYSYSAFAKYLYGIEKDNCSIFSVDLFENYLKKIHLYKNQDICRFNNGYKKYVHYSSLGKRLFAILSIFSHKELINLYLSSKKIDVLKRIKREDNVY